MTKYLKYYAQEGTVTAPQRTVLNMLTIELTLSP